jgi:tetratricopeptide (TPR) repeat protein
MCTGKCVEAFAQYGEALKVMRRVYGGDHPTIAETLRDQANVHEMLGNYREALPIYAESLRMYREVYGTDHPAIAEIQVTVATFQNTFMHDLQQYAEQINTGWAYDVKSFRYGKAQRVAAAQFVLGFTEERGLLDLQLIEQHPDYEQHAGPLGEGQLGHLMEELRRLTSPVQPPSLQAP